MPLRTAFVYFPNGAIPATWWPSEEGDRFSLSRTLAPLERVRNFVQVLGAPVLERLRHPQASTSSISAAAMETTKN